MTPPRVAIDARYLSDRPSGIGRYSENLVRRLPALAPGIEWVVLAGEGWTPPDPVPKNLKIVRPGIRPGGPGSLTLGGVINRLGCQVIHFHSPIIPLNLRVPYIVTFHDWQPLVDPEFHSGRPWPLPQMYEAFYQRMYPQAARKARAVIADSDYTAGLTRTFVPEAALRVRRIHCGLDRRFLVEAAGADNAAEREAEIGPRNILYVGSDRPNKNLPTMIRAFARIRARPDFKHITLTMIMSGGRFASRIRELIKAEGRDSHVRILDELSDDELIARYRGASLLSFASEHEGFGFPLLEGMACGVPVVIADSGSLPEIARGAARIVPPRDADALAEAWAELLAGGEDAARRIELGRLRARDFDWDRCAAETLAVIEEQLRNGGVP